MTVTHALAADTSGTALYIAPEVLSGQSPTVQSDLYVLGLMLYQMIVGSANPNTASAPPASGGGYFIIKNSWGAAYGDAGYAYIPVDYLNGNAVEVVLVSLFGQH